MVMRLFLPEEWTSKPDRCRRAQVPEAQQKPWTKPEVAIEELDRVLALGVRLGCVVADAGYGISAVFRRADARRHKASLDPRAVFPEVGIPFTHPAPTSGGTVRRRSESGLFFTTAPTRPSVRPNEPYGILGQDAAGAYMLLALTCVKGIPTFPDSPSAHVPTTFRHQTENPILKAPRTARLRFRTRAPPTGFIGLVVESARGRRLIALIGAARRSAGRSTGLGRRRTRRFAADARQSNDRIWAKNLRAPSVI